MTIETIAEEATAALRDAYGEDILGVGWYDGRHDDRTASVYVVDSLDTDPQDDDSVLRGALFESFSHDLQEGLHDERLHSTAHIYDSLVDINVPVTEYAGLVVALDADGDAGITDVVDLVHREAPTEIDLSSEN